MFMNLKHKVGRICNSIILLLISVVVSTAQNIELKEANVVSLKLNGSQRLAGQSVEVITANDIQRMNIRSIDELLRFLPLADIQSRGVFGAQSDISLRGSSFNQVLILVDGMRSGDPLTGHFAAYLPVSIAEIERIEILRGPAAAIYGADAVGGVIHIITKTNPEIHQSTRAQTILKGTFGSYGFRGMEAGFLSGSVQRSGAKWLHNGGMQWNQAIGPPNSDTSHAGFNNITGSYALGYSSANGRIRMQTRFGWDARAFDARNFYTLNPSDQSIEDVNRWMLQHKSILNPTSSRPIEISVNHVQGRDSFLFSPAARANVHQTSYTSLMLAQRNEYNDRHWFLYGLMLDDRRIQSNDRGNRLNQRASAFFLSQYKRTNFKLNYGFRTEWDDHYGFQVLPQLSAVHRKNDYVFRFMAGRGIRGADFTERYINSSIPSQLAAERNVGNPDLRAETFWNTEMGFRWIAEGFTFEANAFYRLGNNLIDYRIEKGSVIAERISGTTTFDPSSSYLWADNIRRLDVSGIELIAHYEKSWSNLKTLNMSFGYGYNALLFEGNDFSKYISGTSRQLLNGTVRYTMRGFTIQSQCLYKDRYAINLPPSPSAYAPQYVQLNLKLAVHPMAEMSAFIEINNALDTTISDILGAVLPGRWFLFGVQYGLDNYN
jgi:vitamin B12 transporter